jgi:CzcA family heavy metal efflux pump
MIRWIIWSSLKLRYVVVTLAVLLMVFGFTVLNDVPVDALPEFSLPRVEVQTEALGLSAEEMEALITTPMEADLLNGVSWVKDIRSESIPGLSSIVLTFEKDTDIMRARQMVQERLVGITGLPSISTPPAMVNPISSVNRCMVIGLTSKKLSLIETSVLARWVIRPRLMGVPGVANVSIWGQRERQLQVRVDPERLRDEGVSLMQVIRTTGNALWVSPLTFLEASTPGTGGWVDTPNQRLGVRHVLPIKTAEDLAKVSIEGAPSKDLGDVATVVEDHQPLIGDAIVEDSPALMLVVEKFPWANTMEVTEDVEEALGTLRPGLSGLEMNSTLFRPATFVERGLWNLSMALIVGVLLMISALFAFLYNWRLALIATLSILVSVIAAGTVLYACYAKVNMLVIAGLMLALAAIIDDTIGGTENIARRLRQAREEKNGKSAASIILEATHEMRAPLIYATVIMVLAVMPLLFLEGVSGAFWKPLAVSYLLALLASMVVAMTFTPALSLLFLRKGLAPSCDSPIMGKLRGVYDSLFGLVGNTPRTAFIAVCAVLVVGLASITFLHQGSILPDFKETDLVVRWEGGSGASLPAMSRITSLVSRELRSITGVRNVSAQEGRAIMSDKRASINSGELWVSIDPAADYDATVAAVKEVVAGYPGLSPEVMTYLQAKVRDELSGIGESFVVRVYGEDMKVISTNAEEMRNIMAGIEGIVNAKVQYPKVEPTLEIEVNIGKAKSYGLKPGDVRRSATTLVSGLLVGNLFEEQKVFDVVVWSTPETRHSLDSIRNLLIDTPMGGQVRLQDVADVRIKPAATVIKRDAVVRYLDVTAIVHGRDPVAVATDIKRGIGKVSFPLEYRAELLGEYAERQAARERVFAFAIAAAIGILLILQAFFRSWRLAAVVFLTLPMALTGGVLAEFLSGGVLSLGSIIGFFAVLGIAARNSILMVSRYRHLERDGDAPVSAELVKRCTSDRSGPVLMAAVMTAMVLFPLVFFGDIAGLEFVRPMAIVVLGGLVTTTLFTLAGIPSMYLLFGAKREPDLELEASEAIRRVQGEE